MNAFEALGLNEQLVQAISDLGFDTPTPIQEQAIPILLSGTTDFVGLAQTGTGKTAAFGLPLLHLINISERHPQALIVCPTRELCLQITNDLATLAQVRDLVAMSVKRGGFPPQYLNRLQIAVDEAVTKGERRRHLVDVEIVPGPDDVPDLVGDGVGGGCALVMHDGKCFVGICVDARGKAASMRIVDDEYGDVGAILVA